MGLGKVGLLGKALKLQTLWKRIAAPIKVFEDIKADPDGSAVYIFQARFPTVEDAKMFKELQQLSADLESEVQGKA